MRAYVSIIGTAEALLCLRSDWFTTSLLPDSPSCDCGAIAWAHTNGLQEHSCAPLGRVRIWTCPRRTAQTHRRGLLSRTKRTYVRRASVLDVWWRVINLMQLRVPCQRRQFCDGCVREEFSCFVDSNRVQPAPVNNWTDAAHDACSRRRLL